MKLEWPFQCGSVLVGFFFSHLEALRDVFEIIALPL